MFKNRPCGCKGIRSCFTCEKECGAWRVESSLKLLDENSKAKAYVYCPLCDLAYPGWNYDIWNSHPTHEGSPLRFPGVKMYLNIITEEEENKLVTQLDEIPWQASQSGRRKQNFGPKCNFKKKTVKVAEFDGFPVCTKFIQERFKELHLLRDFQTIEQCSLEYVSDKGAAIDPHVDDCWIWGERIPTLSLLSNSFLTLHKFLGPFIKYNVSEICKYPPKIVENGSRVKMEKEIEEEISTWKESYPNYINSEPNNDLIIRIPLPRFSLLILYGEARYNWEHSILREDIQNRRVCITYREFTPNFQPYGIHSNIGCKIIDTSKNFWDHRVKYKL